MNRIQISIPDLTNLDISDQNPSIQITNVLVSPNPELQISEFIGEISESELTQLFQEIIVRFNTEPKRYEKLDFKFLIEALIESYKLCKQKSTQIELNLSDTKTELVTKINTDISTTKAVLQSEINTKVDKEVGKSLMSSEEHSKLEGIESGSLKNVQSDWNQTDSTKDDYIKHKPIIPTDYVTRTEFEQSKLLIYAGL